MVNLPVLILILVVVVSGSIIPPGAANVSGCGAGEPESRTRLTSKRIFQYILNFIFKSYFLVSCTRQNKVNWSKLNSSWQCYLKLLKDNGHATSTVK